MARRRKRAVPFPPTTNHNISCSREAISTSLHCLHSWAESPPLLSVHSRVVCDTFCSGLNSRDSGDRPLRDPRSVPCSESVWGKKGWVLCKLNRPSFLYFPRHHLFLSQEALAVFKEAVQKMPRQFAPQSLYNMMGKSYSNGKLCLGNYKLFAGSQSALCSPSVEAAAAR